MKRLVALSLLTCSTLLFASTAVAQDQTWMNDRKYREGAGFRVGNFELHPGIGADFGYDSNYLRRESSEDPVGSLRIRVSPSFSVSTLGPQRSEGGTPPSVRFRMDIGATYNEFIPVSGSDAAKDALQQQRNIGGAARLNLDILPQRTWSGRIHGGVGRTTRPTGESSLTESFNRILPNAGAELIWTPGSGMLDWRLGYEFSGTFFESGDFQGLNSTRHDVTTRGRWRFLPRTALMFDGRFGFLNYSDTTSSVNKTSSRPMRARIGLNGLITPSFGILALVGWGSSFYFEDDQDFDSVIGQLELKWYITPTPSTDPARVSALLSSVAVGFIRDYEDSLIGTYLERDQGYARFNYLFAGKFLLVADVRAGAVVYPAQTGPDFGQPSGWTDMRLDGKLFGEYRVKDYLGINAELGYTGYFSSTGLTFATGRDAMGYHDISAFLGARWFM